MVARARVCLFVLIFAYTNTQFNAVTKSIYCRTSLLPIGHDILGKKSPHGSFHLASPAALRCPPPTHSLPPKRFTFILSIYTLCFLRARCAPASTAHPIFISFINSPIAISLICCILFGSLSTRLGGSGAAVVFVVAAVAFDHYRPSKTFIQH